MADAPYVTVTGRLKPFFKKIQEIAKPSVVDRNWLKSIGFGSKNEAGLISIVRALQFVDSSGKPTDRWSEYRRTSRAPEALAAGIRDAYAELFQTYASAHEINETDLSKFFKSKTNLSNYTIARAVGTFRTLCEMADFAAVESVSAAAEAPDTRPIAEDGGTGMLRAIKGLGPGVTINVNIQLSLPATTDEKVYQKLFAALKKHILS